MLNNKAFQKILYFISVNFSTKVGKSGKLWENVGILLYFWRKLVGCDKSHRFI